MFTFIDLQNEVKRGAQRNQAGGEFDTAAKNLVNRALSNIARQAPWRSLRRRTHFTTVIDYSTASGAVMATNSSSTVTVPGATFLTDGIEIGRRIKFGGSGIYYYIREIQNETKIVLDQVYNGTTTTTDTYSIYPQEEYNMPIQADHRTFIWHENYGYPYYMEYITDQDFYKAGVQPVTKGVPNAYRMWGENMVIEQLRTASQVSVSSSSGSDTALEVTVFGKVAGFGNAAGYPQTEVVNLDSNDSTIAVTTATSFLSVERIVKGATTNGQIIAMGDSVATGGITYWYTTLAVIPQGDMTEGIQYSKIQLYPLPKDVFDVQVQHYKDPFKLVNDGDVHELGADFDQAIILLASAMSKYEDNQDEGDKFYQLFLAEMKTLRRRNMDKIDWQPTMRRPRDGRRSSFMVARNLSYGQIGSNYGPRSLR